MFRKDRAQASARNVPLVPTIAESDTPNALTANTLHKSRRGHDVTHVTNGSELFGQLNTPSDSPGFSVDSRTF